MINIDHISDTKAYRIDEIASMLGFTTRTIKRWINDPTNTLHAIKCKRDIRVIGANLKEFLKANEVKPWI